MTLSSTFMASQAIPHRMANDKATYQSPMTPGYFGEQLQRLDWAQSTDAIMNKSAADVLMALQKTRLTPDDFMALICPAAEAYLPLMMQRSQALTRQRFGYGMTLFAPLYLSNACANECLYCGFSMSNSIKRLTLDERALQPEIKALKQKGFDHLLLVTGETRKVSMAYFSRMLPLIKPHFSHVSMEVQPLEIADYQQLRQYGLDAVLVYQETYRPSTYAQQHIRGKKADFYYRLEAPDRIGSAQVHKIGLGVLLGLDDWRTDSLMMAHHLRHLQKHYWRSRFSVSFPRIRPCEGGTVPKSILTDKQLIQLLCAWRLFDADLELTLSTRESPWLRDHILDLGFTSMSAESKTQPGGYDSQSVSALEQFEIADERCVADVARSIRAKGLEVIWKDWDAALAG